MLVAGQFTFTPRRFRYLSGKERMREFRRSHPNYDRDRHAKDRAAKAALKAQQEALKVAVPVEVPVEAPAVPVVRTLPIPEYRLALPAPVVDPIMLELEALCARVKQRKREQHAMANLTR